MNAPREDGLSSQDEFDQLIQLEDTVCSAIVRNSSSIFVGRNTSDGNRDFYFYTRNDKAFSAALRAAMGEFPEYKHQTGTRRDPEWRTHLGFLFPNPRDQHRIINRRVCEQLENDGDMLTKPRQIDHLVYFEREDAAKKFIAEIQAAGFNLVRFDPPNDEKMRFAVKFSRVDKPSEINQVVWSVYDTAIALLGDYDGWGCSVTK